MNLRERPDRGGRSNKEVFAGLYEANLSRVFRYIYYRVGNVNVAEDLTSAVFEKALAKFNSYRSDKASFSTWLLSIACHKTIDYYREKNRQLAVDPSRQHESTSGIMEEFVKKEEFQRLLLFLSRLSPLEQEIISLKFGSRLTNRQIAKVLGLSESNVGTMLYRAIRRLRAKFQEDGRK